MALLKALAVLLIVFVLIMFLIGVPQNMWRNHQAKKVAGEQKAANDQEAA